MISFQSLTIALLLTLQILPAHSDGNGLIGWGKTLYHPPCAFACRGVLRNCQLECTPEASEENHGTAHNPVVTPPECFVTGRVFLRTMALCIETYCFGVGGVETGLIEAYWGEHLGTGTLGSLEYEPAMSYVQALEEARRDEDAASENGMAGGEGAQARVRVKRQHDQGAEVVPEAIGPDVSGPLPVVVSAIL